MKNANKKILLIGASLHSDNRGVNALGLGAITLLSNNYPDASISLLCVGEFRELTERVVIGNKTKEVSVHYFSKENVIKSFFEAYAYRLLSKKRTPRLAISALISSSDIVFDINEGDSFSDIYGLKRIVRHFTDSRLILSWKKPLIFLPQTLGPFNTLLGKVLARHIICRLEKLYVRDRKAFPFLDKMSAKKELSIDMAVYMTSEKVDLKVKPNSVGININGLMYLNRYKSLGGKYAAYPEFLSGLVKKVISEGYEVILIPHTYNASQPNTEDDLMAINKFLSSDPSFLNKVSYVDGQYNAQQLKWIISQTVFFLGSRMHSCIAALSTSTPTIGLSYSYKFEGTFKMFGQQDNVISLNDLKKETIPTLIEEISVTLSNSKSIAKSLEKANQREMLTIKTTEDDK